MERSFPKLQSIEICSRLIGSEEDFIAGMRWSHSIPSNLTLFFSVEDLDLMPDSAITGSIVHELCHAEYDLDLPSAIFAANEAEYASSPEDRAEQQRAIDLAVIEKGYGEELLALQMYHDEHYDAYRRSDRLTTRETKAILRSRSQKALTKNIRQ